MIFKNALIFCLFLPLVLQSQTERMPCYNLIPEEFVQDVSPLCLEGLACEFCVFMDDSPNCGTGTGPFPFPGCEGGFALHSPNWVGFYASGSEISMSIEVEDCLNIPPDLQGIQFGVYELVGELGSADCNIGSEPLEVVYTIPSSPSSLPQCACISPGVYQYIFETNPGSTYFMVFDGCGTDLCAVNIRMSTDGEPPAATCADTLENIMMPSTGQLSLWPEDLLDSNYFQCSDIEYRFWYSYVDSFDYPDQSVDWQYPTDSSSAQDLLDSLPEALIFYCESLGGHNLSKFFNVEVFIIESSGEWTVCNTLVEIVDLDFVCYYDEPPIISGKITTCNDERLDDVFVLITDRSSGGLNPRETTTDYDGGFRFIVAPGFDWRLQPFKDDAYLNGVTAADFIILLNHITGTSILTDPYTILAADVTGDLAIDFRDLIALRRLLLGIDDELENVPSWLFIDANYSFPGISSYQLPASVRNAQWIDLFDVVSNSFNNDFIGIKTGDLECDAVSTSFNCESCPALKLTLHDAVFHEDEEFVVPLYINDFVDVQGFQATLTYDETKLELVANSIILDGVFAGRNELKQGVLPLLGVIDNMQSVYSPQQILSLTFKAKDNGQLSESLSISSDVIETMAISENFERWNVEMKFDYTENIGHQASFELFQNSPNPVLAETEIKFILPYGQPCVLSFYSADGKQICQDEITGEKGDNSYWINPKELLGVDQQLIFYRIKTPSGSATKKMILN